MTPEERREFMRTIGSKGGKATADKYGPTYMSNLGKRGFIGLARRFGDNGQAVGYLQDMRGMPGKPRKEWSKNKLWDE